jgi:hypothetical protein
MKPQLTRYKSAILLTENEKDAKEILNIAKWIDLDNSIFSEPTIYKNLASMHGYNTSAANGGSYRHSDYT